MTSETHGHWAPFDNVDPESRVVGLGALCELRKEHGSVSVQSFGVSEFATLANGERRTLHRVRGFTIGSNDGSAVRVGMTAESIAESVLSTVLPSGDDCDDAHPWQWLAELAQTQGLPVSAEDLQPLPYEVVLADSVTTWLGRP